MPLTYLWPRKWTRTHTYIHTYLHESDFKKPGARWYATSVRLVFYNKSMKLSLTDYQACMYTPISPMFALYV